MLMISTRPIVHMSRKHNDYIAAVLVLMGKVDGRGYDGQQKDTICDVCEPCQKIRSKIKPVFRWFRLIGYTYELLGCLDVKI